MSYDPRNEPPQPGLYYTEDAVDRIRSGAFIGGMAVGVITGLISATLFTIWFG